MTILTVAAKGQVSLRKDLLQHLGVQPGGKVVLDKLPDGRIAVRAATRMSDVFGLLKRASAPAVSVEEIGAIGAGWAGKR